MADEQHDSGRLDFVVYAAKFFVDREHADEFVRGRILLNSLAFFRRLEDGKSEAGRRDEDEAPAAWIQPHEGLLFKINDLQIPHTDIAGPIKFHLPRDGTKNLLCLYVCYSRGHVEMVNEIQLQLLRETPEGLEAFRRHLKVEERCLKMGEYAVLFLDFKGFLDKMIEYNRRHGFYLKAGAVAYFDPRTFSGKFEHPEFSKRQEFDWQSEYRFALDRNVEMPEPYVVDLGDLSDICRVVPARSLVTDINYGPR